MQGVPAPQPNAAVSATAPLARAVHAAVSAPLGPPMKNSTPPQSAISAAPSGASMCQKRESRC
ncbi:MAG: hypothetical protein R3F11_26710 [Verrucomicrobiales bacterium]